MKKQRIILLTMLVLIIIGCTSGNAKKVRDGHLDAFGYEVTVGEAFDVVSGNSTSWGESELDDSRYPNETYSLIEAKWDGESGKVVVQFVVEKEGLNFQLHGASVGGQFMDAYSLISGIESEYNKRTN